MRIRIDRQTRKYIVEDGEEQVNNNVNQTEQPKPASIVNLNTAEIVQMKADKSKKLEDYQKTISQIDDKKRQLQTKLAQSQDQNLQQSELNSIQRQIIQLENDICKKKYEMATAEYQEQTKILQAQSKLVETRMYPKYPCLHESNIYKAKIYFTKLFENDPQQRVQTMNDLKKIFAESNILIGKDKDGYYGVCVDQEDFNNIVNSLEKAGFNRNDAINIILPQIFNRTNLL